MIGFKQTAMVFLLAGLGFNGTSQAALIARGGGMVYDDVNNITWAADANLFKTQYDSNPNLVNEIIAGNGGVIHDMPSYYDGHTGIHNLASTDFADTYGGHTFGVMTWWGAQAWANNLTLGGVKGWSLPTTPDAANFTNNYGYNVTTSQMGDLFYNQLGGVAHTSIVTIHNANYNLFTNVQSFAYWSGSEYAPNPATAWDFSTYNDNRQYYNAKSGPLYAWAVHSGDVAAVPVPAAVWLFGSGLIGLLSFTRSKNKTVNIVTA